MIKKDRSNDFRFLDQAKEQTIDFKKSSKVENLPFNYSNNTTPYLDPEKIMLHDLWLTCESLQDEIETIKNLNSVSDGCMLEITDASFEHIGKVLHYLPEMLDNRLFQINTHREPEIYKALSSRTLKAIMLSDLITKSAEEYVSPDILKVLLERGAMQKIFKKGDSIIIEVLPDNTLKIYGEQSKENA